MPKTEKDILRLYDFLIIFKIGNLPFDLLIRFQGHDLGKKSSQR